ncbi:MAG: KEOPS complex subunit Pcc1 [Candidatus Methanoperedens sp.]|nr:KEOPS complex subunit Pcc1 [Candidatus Methanoperedens sp.]MCZ7395050.1 KEOPS complex subunit Pcc1 [Candidatus Methanoperedens sp.]
MLVLAEFEFDLGTDAGIIYESLLPELEEEYQRTKTTLESQNNVLILKVEAGDFVSMRAALNGWLRLVKITTEMCSITQVIN